MRKLPSVVVGACLLLGAALTVRAQESDARAIVLKAIKAHGGADKLAKYQAAYAKAKGTLEINNMSAKFSVESFVQFPDKIKTVVDIDINNMNILVTSVFNGTKAWVQVGGNTMELNDKKIIENFHETMYAEKVASLADLGDKKYQLDLIGNVKVMDQETIGVRVSSKGRRDVSLYFDKKTSLMVKSEYRGVEPMNNQEVNQEKYFSDYREVEGIQSPRKVVVHNDGKKVADVEITETRLLDRHDDSVFAKP